VVERTVAHRRGLSMAMSFGGRGTTVVRADTEPSAVRFSSGGPMDHGEAFGSSYMVGGRRMVAIDGEPFTDREAVGDELTPGSLGDDLSSIRVLGEEDVEGVLLPSFDGDWGASQCPTMVVLLARRRVKQRGERQREGEGELEASFLCWAMHEWVRTLPRGVVATGSLR
jgi:hypothetical protein